MYITVIWEPVVCVVVIRPHHGNTCHKNHDSFFGADTQGAPQHSDSQWILLDIGTNRTQNAGIARRGRQALGLRGFQGLKFLATRLKI